MERQRGENPSITIITPFYPPETSAAANRAWAVAGVFAASGWTTRVITQLPNYPQGRLYKGYENKKSVNRNGNITIIRLKPFIIAPRGNIVLRFLAEIVFSLKAVEEFRKNRSDIVFTTSLYMFNGPFVCLCGALLKRAVIWEVRDLTWLYMTAVNKKTFGLHKLIERIMLFTAGKTKAMITTTSGQAKYFAENSKVRRVKVFPNGVSREHIRIINNARPMPKKRFTVVYAGLIGYPQGLSTLIEAAARLADIDFILVGDGAEKPKLEKLAAQLGIKNVTFTGYLSPDQVAGYYRTADVLYAQLRNARVFENTQPSKIWEYMAAGKPVIYGGSGEAAQTVNISGCGVVVEPENPALLAEAIKSLRRDSEALKRMGEAGRIYVSANYTREIIFKDLVGYIEDVI